MTRDEANESGAAWLRYAFAKKEANTFLILNTKITIQEYTQCFYKSRNIHVKINCKSKANPELADNAKADCILSLS